MDLNKLADLHDKKQKDAASLQALLGDCYATAYKWGQVLGIELAILTLSANQHEPGEWYFTMAGGAAGEVKQFGPYMTKSIACAEIDRLSDPNSDEPGVLRKGPYRHEQARL